MSTGTTSATGRHSGRGEPGEHALPLRERKKLRTRRALVSAALELFTERGFDQVTLDELVDRVEVSKRTFFRTFAAKEDVALAPEQEFWATYLGAFADERPLSGLLIDRLRDALLDTLAAMPEDWEARFLTSRRLAEATPALTAHSLAFCVRTTDELGGLLVRGLGPAVTGTDDPRLRLATDVMLAVWRLALHDWTADGGPATRAALTVRLVAAFDALPQSLALRAD